MTSFMSNNKFWKIFFLTLKSIGILLAFSLILPLFRETQLSVMFCALLYESHTTEELIGLRREDIVNCVGPKRVIKPGIVSMFTVIMWISLESSFSWILKVVPWIPASPIVVFEWYRRCEVYFGFWGW